MHFQGNFFSIPEGGSVISLLNRGPTISDHLSLYMSGRFGRSIAQGRKIPN